MLHTKLFYSFLIVIAVFLYPMVVYSADTKTDMRIDVPFQSIYWTPWKDDQLGTGKHTIQKMGCALTCMAMVLNYYGYDTDPGRLNTWLKANDGYFQDDLLIWYQCEVFTKGKVKFIDSINYEGSADLIQIKNEIDKGYPVIARVVTNNITHFVVITGYNGDKFYINDTWTEDPSQTINEKFPPLNNPASAIHQIVIMRSSVKLPPKVPVVKLSSIYKEPLYLDTPPKIKALGISLFLDDTMMSVGQTKKEIDPGRSTKPQVINNRTLIPIRSILEELGGQVIWSDTDKKITIKIKNRTIELWSGKRTAYFNGEAFCLDVPVTALEERTYVPLRAILEKLNLKVDWDGTLSKISITSP